MLSELFQKTRLFFLLVWIDKDLADAQRDAGCPYCGGPLHYSNYQRKPRGGPSGIPEECLVRFSLCCGREKCRKRTLPPSCRFMGRRVYWHGIILITLTLKQQRPDGISIKTLMDLYGFSRNTLLRWLAWYRDIFPSSPSWQRIRGRICSSVPNDNLPCDLLKYFLRHSTSPLKGLVSCLGLLSGVLIY